MGKIILKLVGYSSSINDFHIDVEDNNFCLSDIISFMIDKGMSYQEINEIKFIHAGKNIDNDKSKKYILENNDEFVIYLYSNLMTVKMELAKHIFESNQEIESPKKQHLPDIEEEPIIDESSKINLETIKLFQEPDFRYLLNICLNKPEYISKVASYIINGNITSHITNCNIDNFKYNSEYDNVIQILQSINYTKINELYIKNIVHHFEGNINLIIRYIINTDK
jgi:hypothetical protein